MKQLACFVILASLVNPPRAFAQSKDSADPDGLIAAAKQFVAHVDQGDFTAAVANFDKTMKTVMPAETLETVWKSLVAKVGRLKKTLGTRTQNVRQFRIVFVTCEFEMAKLDVKVVFDRNGQITGLFFVPAKKPVEFKPPDYADRDTFAEQAVHVGTGEWTLPGTLSLPKRDGPFPAVVLVHGSGPNDSDETIGPNKPFRDLAWGLATRGIAVLRYDKRTMVHGTKLTRQKDEITVKEETVDDALAAVELLRKTDDIDIKKIFVLGHSLGGMLTPRIGKRDSQISGFIVLAGTTRRFEDVILDQFTYIYSLDGQVSETEQTRLDALKAKVAKVKDPELSVEVSGAELPLGIPAKYWLDLRGYDPPEVAAKLSQPFLILQGGRDYQVTNDDFNGWKRTLSGRKNVTFKLFGKLNHLFISGDGKITPAEYQQAGHVAEEVIDTIVQWVRHR